MRARGGLLGEKCAERASAETSAHFIHAGRTVNRTYLSAYIHALRWARTSPEAAGRPVLLRHDSKYAALVSSGVWKGKSKKNKALVGVAQEEWRLTYAAKKGKLWIRHVKGHSGHEWNDMADQLADDGRRGVQHRGAARMVD